VNDEIAPFENLESKSIVHVKKFSVEELALPWLVAARSNQEK